MIYLWAPLVFANYCLVAWLTFKNSSVGGTWFYAMWALGLVPLWPLIAKYSKDIVFDGLVYDILMTVGYTGAILVLTKSLGKMGPAQFAGLTMILGGLYFFKKGI